jgi:hypothetical protein
MKNVSVYSIVKNVGITELSTVNTTQNISVSTEKQTKLDLPSSITSGKTKSLDCKQLSLNGPLYTRQLDGVTQAMLQLRSEIYSRELQNLTTLKLTPAQGFDPHKVWEGKPDKKFDALPKPCIVWIPRKGTFAITKAMPPGPHHRYGDWFLAGYTKSAANPA